MPADDDNTVRHFNPRSPHGERLERYAPICSSSNFNPRSPHGERQNGASVNTGFITFQSTLPARGATAFSLAVAALVADFNPRSPHGERRGAV